MVVLVDLDEAPSTPSLLEPPPHPGEHRRGGTLQEINLEKEEEDDARPNPNINGFSAALSCYPIVSQLASQIDLNTLHDLSRTCRQFRANLLQYRRQLVTQTLRCANEDQPVNASLADRFRESHSAWVGQSLGSYSHRITSGKIGQCARDMVGDCRRCGKIVCRNCTIKPPPTNAMHGRHRRLCTPCTKAPLALHFQNRLPALPSPHGTPSQRSTPSPEPLPALTPVSSNVETPPAFTVEAFARTPCSCADALWLCQPCGLSLRSDDTTYYRGWTWRTRYSEYLGGLGTGVGEGDQGVACGRESTCLAARTLEKERDASDAELAAQLAQNVQVERDGTGRSWRGGSWTVQEIENVGGGMRMKTKTMERIGAVVKEFEDERDGQRAPLAREKAGERRSWCSWCRRVIPGQKDL
ncbi:hypothetical protein EJ05DRAFT_490136 [Pseudovirgaria hyperparasitica]|uniref:F-box domain-containing protein n=1 Tax=Pseudovirgaria hyperparasitica TaxID=470096 RepID=A0A6A6VU66_9PEZI|nr:uncharacterized protein EJ05DRAFT_490136 [Pseudovirgaria hyperparasitica]KAF2753439.1 hypothetical protein EJ05DRAFT_490136 [Pseudovirgaria hyperparasitica]